MKAHRKTETNTALPRTTVIPATDWAAIRAARFKEQCLALLKDKYLHWTYDEARRDAAAGLGRLKDPAAVPALASVLWDEDEDEDASLRARAIEALAEIGHQDGVGPLVPLLGDIRGADGRRIRDRVAEALRQLGEGELVDTVLAALGGDFGHLKALDGGYRAQVIAALSVALEGPSGEHAANALAEIHAGGSAAAAPRSPEEPCPGRPQGSGRV